MSSQCQALTQDNKQCTRNNLENSNYCWQHSSFKYFKYPNNQIECQTDDLLSKDEGVVIGQGKYGIVRRYGEVVVKSMILIKEDNDVEIADLKELCFLAQYSNPAISNLKCVKIEENKIGSHNGDELINFQVDIYQKYSGLPLSTRESDLDLILTQNMKEAKRVINRNFDRIIDNISPTIDSYESLINSVVQKLDTLKINFQIVKNDLENIKKDQSVTNLVRQNIFDVLYQLLSLFEQMESLDIIHADIKPNNIVVDNDLKVTLIDWGFCFLDSKYLSNLLQTAGYQAPEAKNSKFYGPINDIYALGLSILSLYTNDSIRNLRYDQILKIQIPDPVLKDILFSMIEPDYKKRKPASELIKNKVFDKYRSKINIFSIKPILEIKPNYFETQPDLKPVMREILLDWIYDILKSMSRLPTFVLAVRLMDTYLSYAIVNRKKIQLVGSVCAYLAQIFTYELIVGEEDFVRLSNGAYKLRDFTQSLLEVLKVLEYRVFEKTFDRQIQNVQYNIIGLVMLDGRNIGKSNQDMIVAYEKIKNMAPGSTFNHGIRWNQFNLTKYGYIVK